MSTRPLVVAAAASRFCWVAQLAEQRTENLVFYSLAQIVTSTEREQSRQNAAIPDRRIVNMMSTARVEPNGNDGKDSALRTGSRTVAANEHLLHQSDHDFCVASAGCPTSA